MITNIVVSMPMPIHSGGGNGDPKIMIALTIVVAIVSVLLIVGGIIYDGIMYNKWTLRTEPDIPYKSAYMNIAKTIGYFVLPSEITIIVLVWLIISVSELL